MSLPKQILVPTDLGSMSDVALDYAVDLAKPIGATVRLLHVFEPPTFDLPEGMLVGLGDAIRRIVVAAEKALESAIEARRDRGVTIESTVREGRAWRVIVDEATSMEDVIIVMATHGRTGLERAILGSVTEKVVRAAPCPVVAVPPAPPAA